MRAVGRRSAEQMPYCRSLPRWFSLRSALVGEVSEVSDFPFPIFFPLFSPSLATHEACAHARGRKINQKSKTTDYTDYTDHAVGDRFRPRLLWQAARKRTSR